MFIEQRCSQMHKLDRKKWQIKLFGFKPQEGNIWLVRIEEHCLILFSLKKIFDTFSALIMKQKLLISM